LCPKSQQEAEQYMIGAGPPSKTIIFILQTLQWQSYEFMNKKNSSDSLLWKMQSEHNIQVKFMFVFCEELNLIWAGSRNMSILHHLSTLNYSNKTQKNRDAQGCSRLSWTKMLTLALLVLVAAATYWDYGLKEEWSYLLPDLCRTRAKWWNHPQSIWVWNFWTVSNRFILNEFNNLRKLHCTTVSTEDHKSLAVLLDGRNQFVDCWNWVGISPVKITQLVRQFQEPK
jgi:hypothetical protein